MPVRTAKDADLERLDAVVEPRALTGLDQPLWLQNSTYPAALDRLLVASALEPGVLGLGELAVTARAAGANMSVDVAAGRVVVPVTDSPNQGSALCRSTQVNNLTVTGAPGAGLSRRDLVIARVYDASLIGGSINGWQLEIVTGTPASSPTVPATPASSLVLAQIAVAAGQATVTAASITDLRTMPGIWRPYNPTIYGSISSPGLGPGGSLSGAYMQRGKHVEFWARWDMGSAPSGGQGNLGLTLPVPTTNPVKVPNNGTAYLFIAGATNQGNYIGITWMITPNVAGALFPGQPTDVRTAIWMATNASNAAGISIPVVPGGYCVTANGLFIAQGVYEAA